MKKNPVRINEGQLRKIVAETVRKALNESFENSELAEMVREHGGLRKIDRYVKDARTCAGGGLGFDIRYASPRYYLSPETVSEIDNAGLYFDIEEKVLYTNDGGAIVIEIGDYDYPGGREAYDKEVGAPYDNKMYHRGKNFTAKNPKSERFMGNWSDYDILGKYSTSPGRYRSTVARERRDAHQNNQKDTRSNK